MGRSCYMHNIYIGIFYKIAEIVICGTVFVEFFLGFGLCLLKMFAVNIAHCHKATIFVAREMVRRPAYTANADNTFC